ncbi:MAG TPA: isocitrate dehydrogenase kinase/phosphatase AceK regulatory subunit, partial [Ignavibacteriaceae bacterium]
IITDQNFNTQFEDFERDAGYVSNEVSLLLWPYIRCGKTYSIDIIKSCFYRNKVAYVVGRINVDSLYIPLILPLYNDSSGIYIDSVLLDKTDANNIFGFVYSYFLVNIELPNQLIGFLRTILSEKQVSELYNSIGFPRHGKTDFYRDLHRFVHISKEKFEYAPGEEGAVMMVFTLPNYNYVFKVIKDRPCFILSSKMTDKNISKAKVRYKYNYVSLRDRVGRLVDTQEFENLRFKRKRFSEKLLEDFNKAAKGAIEITGDYVIINHTYIQRRVTPLPIYLDQESNVNTLREIVIDFGYFFKDLAASGLFPADLFNTWNYGVTENKRIVSYDYDDIIPLENANIRIKPAAKDDLEELSPGEEWIIADRNDYFLDEIEKFIGLPETLKGLFKSVHSDLYSLDFWNRMKASLGSKEIIDIIPYNRTKRFERISRQA